jgi:hypothetical protein
VDDGCQPKVELVAKDRNVIAATFIHFLLKNIGTVAAANSCITLYRTCRTTFIPPWYSFLILHVYPHGTPYFFMLLDIVKENIAENIWPNTRGGMLASQVE